MERKRVHYASRDDFKEKRNHPYENKKLSSEHVDKNKTFIKAEASSSRELHHTGSGGSRETDLQLHTPVIQQESFTHLDKFLNPKGFHTGSGGSRETDLQLHKPDINQEPFIHIDETSNLKTHVLEMIVKDLQTPRIVEEGGFQHFMNALNPSTDAALNASAIREDLVNMYVLIKRKVMNAVRKAKDPVLSAELWISDNKESYLTVTCHFVDDTWTLKSYTLETAQLLGEETPENVHLQLCRISTKWKLMEKTQVVIVNMDEMKMNQTSSKWTYIPCFSHILNKAILEVLDSQEWGNLLKKCRHIVQFFYQEKEESWSDRLVQSACVDWLSTLNMLEKICKHWPKFSKVDSYKKAANLWLDENEIKLLENMKDTFNIVKNDTYPIVTHGFFSISNVIPLVDKLQFSLSFLIQQDNEVASRLSEKFTDHFKNIKQNTWFTLSTSLDPRFKSSVLKNEAEKKVMEDLNKEMCKQAGNAMGNRRQSKISDVIFQYVKEGDMQASECPLQYWKAKNKSKDLAMVAHKYLSVISTVIPIERMMHEDKSQVFFNRRKCLELKDINMMLFLNANYQKI